MHFHTYYNSIYNNYNIYVSANIVCIKLDERMEKAIEEIVTFLINLIIGLSVMCWLFGDEDKKRENRKK